MSEMDMSDLLGVFLEEAQEQLQRLDDGILQLEKDPSNIEVLKEIFRAAHTLKGSSATMGLSEMADLTHVMENLLDILRNGGAVATSNMIDLLLEGIDFLRIFVEQISAGEKLNADTGDLISKLKDVCSEVDGSKPTEKLNNSNKVEKKSAKTNIDNILFTLKVAENCLMPAVRAFMIYNALDGLGDVVKADPPQDNLDDIQAGQLISIEFAPNQDAESVKDAMKNLSEIDLIDFVLPGESENEIVAVIEETIKINNTEPAKTSTLSDVSSAAVPKAEAPKAIQTIRVGVDRLDTLMNLVAELVIDKTHIIQIESDMALKYENEESMTGLRETAAHIGRVVTELQEHIMKVRLLPVEQVFSRFPRMVRDLAHKAGKEVEFIMQGQETELDRSILEEIVDPLTHLLRNAVDHGTEMPDVREKAGKPRVAQVILAAKQEENRIIIEVSDSGNGIDVERVKVASLKKGQTSEEQLARMSDEDALQLIFAAGVSTAEKITDVSGRGVGMDVVRNNIQGLSGLVSVNNVPGVGTTFKISLPLTLAIIQGLVVGVAERIFIIPLSAVVETFRCDAADIRHIDSHPAINFRGTVLPLVHMREVFGNESEKEYVQSESSTFVIINTGTSKIGLIVDKLIGEHEVVIKPLGSFFGNLDGIAGATILGDGRVALIVDVTGLGNLLNKRRFDRSKFQLQEAA